MPGFDQLLFLGCVGFPAVDYQDDQVGAGGLRGRVQVKDQDRGVCGVLGQNWVLAQLVGQRGAPRAGRADDGDLHAAQSLVPQGAQIGFL